MKKVIITSLLVSALSLSASAYATNQVQLSVDSAIHKDNTVIFNASTQNGLVGLGSLDKGVNRQIFSTPESLKGGYKVEVTFTTTQNAPPQTFCSTQSYDFSSSSTTLISFDINHPGFEAGPC